MYVANLDAQIEEQGILKAACAATCLWEELHEELRGGGGAGGSGGSNEDDNDNYLHLDEDLDADFLAELLIDVEAADEQRALMASFETQHRNQSVQQLITVESRAVADRLATAQQRRVTRLTVATWRRQGRR
jgi:hypothetical protein